MQTGSGFLRQSPLVWYGFFIIITLLAMVYSLLTGVIKIQTGHLFELIASIWNTDAATGKEALILWNLRMPRAVLSLSVGAALAVSGASMQGIFRNPLVEPGLVGISAGSALAAACVLVFVFPVMGDVSPATSSLILPLSAFAGGLTSTLIIYYIGRNESIAILILAGVAINALCGALIGWVIYYADDSALRSFTFWSLGDLSGANWKSFLIASPFIWLPVLYLCRQHRDLDMLSLGDRQAFHAGIQVESVKKRNIMAVAMAVGASVSLSGAIGFIGLVVPHMIRMMFGPSHKNLMILSVFVGGSLMMLADTFSRTWVQPAELPVGIVTAMIGSPFFIYLIFNTKNKKLL
ncbi:MAG: iron ABC transporter permease [Cyclobacteriaceae bacterium]|nr:iron ABC transporter permease [Cyclobacteriaceae bacterium]